MNDSKLENLEKLRVITVNKNGYLLQSSSKLVIPGYLSGKFQNSAESSLDFPLVGDWVYGVIHAEFVIIEKIQDRMNLLSRVSPSSEFSMQGIAANIDGIMIVMGLDQNFNLNRLERFLSVSSSITNNILIVLTKKDICSDLDEKKQKLEERIKSRKFIFVDALLGDGMEEIPPFLEKEKTYILLGSSGVGKSSIINFLLKSSVQDTSNVREKDSKGKHTTTSRELFSLESGAYIIDNPGVREFQIPGDENLLSFEFTDVLDLEKNCKFTNCSHNQEPGCQIRESLESGELDKKRWESFLKLKRELEYSLTLVDRNKFMEKKEKWKKIHKKAKQIVKDKRKTGFD